MRKEIEMAKDHSFFDDFFNNTPEHKCNECGSTENLVPLGGTSGGAQLYICQSCKASRDNEIAQRRADTQAAVRRSADYDRFEEPHSR
jgi:transposase-like protein